MVTVPGHQCEVHLLATEGFGGGGEGPPQGQDHQTLLTAGENGRDHEHRELSGEGLSGLLCVCVCGVGGGGGGGGGGGD